jgi:endonuclease/exonuclease/phosphatase family metal-dependent hydrolase
VINVHLDSGVEARDRAHRAISIAALEGVLATLQPADDDALIIGDLNTMGSVAPSLTPQDELRALDAALAGQTPALRRLGSSVACTEYYRGRGALLDHALSRVTMAELPVGRVTEVAGPCALHRCALPRGVRAPSLERLSDHCPIVVQLDPSDLD